MGSSTTSMAVKRFPSLAPDLVSPPQKKMETAERAEILFNELEDDPDSGITEEEFIR